MEIVEGSAIDYTSLMQLNNNATQKVDITKLDDKIYVNSGTSLKVATVEIVEAHCLYSSCSPSTEAYIALIAVTDL